MLQVRQKYDPQYQDHQINLASGYDPMADMAEYSARRATGLWWQDGRASG